MLLYYSSVPGETYAPNYPFFFTITIVLFKKILIYIVWIIYFVTPLFNCKTHKTPHIICNVCIQYKQEGECQIIMHHLEKVFLSPWFHAWLRIVDCGYRFRIVTRPNQFWMLVLKKKWKGRTFVSGDLKCSKGICSASGKIANLHGKKLNGFIISLCNSA